MKNEKKMNNKGFSLIELIIVIAIMAVLVAVLAPQYMKFVERGRAASDRDNVKAIESALQVWAVDTEATSTFTGTTTVTLTRPTTVAGGVAPVTQTGVVKDALEAAGLSATVPSLTNRQTFSKVTITVTVNSNGTIEITTAES